MEGVVIFETPKHNFKRIQDAIKYVFSSVLINKNNYQSASFYLTTQALKSLQYLYKNCLLMYANALFVFKLFSFRWSQTSQQ